MAPAIFSSKNKLDSPGPLHKLFTRYDNFKKYPQPTINVSAPDCGPSGVVGNLNSIATAETPAELFPTLTWAFEVNEKDEGLAERLKKIKEYLIVVEDLDGRGKIAASPQPLGIFMVIPPQKSMISANDIVKTKKGKFEWILKAERDLVGGFKYGDLDGKVWRTPKSMHRIHFQVIALSRTVDNGALSEFPTINSFHGASEGSVLGWGEWVGIYEKK